MSLPIALGIYFICWWLAFFIVLPIGVHTQADAGAIEPGTADSAPVTHHILRKALGATALSIVIFGAVYAIATYHLIPWERIPTSLY
ncbi:MULTISPECIES: DUF1467 family protein [Rhodomicrobium]|uniref:DUF1467 family protein n=1 Tax=Rhodomicrobium TaxID=1068 RepID=UPI000B4ABCBD|nr:MULTISPECIES: DUF1467 family protein [Rhodomicrobium]